MEVEVVVEGGSSPGEIRKTKCQHLKKQKSLIESESPSACR